MISVILPSYNSEKTIEAVLTALKEQTYKSPFEIILVDSSDDQTPHIVRSKFPDIKYIHFEKKTDPGTARNIGLKESKGNIILFIDSDCIARNDWIERMVKLHETTDYAGIGGAVVNGNDPNSKVAWAGYMAEFREFVPQHPEKNVDHIPTCNISYKRKYLEELGGFNPDYYPQEDLDFNYRLCKTGAKILFNPQIQVAHNHRTEFKSFFKHQKNVGCITSSMLRILPLKGSSIARSRIKSVLLIPFILLVKWLRTILIFLKLQPQVVFKNPSAVCILFMGLFPWSIGFLKGVFTIKVSK